MINFRMFAKRNLIRLGCYQSGLLVDEPNMAVEDFRWIAEQSKGRCNQFALGGRGDPDQHEHFEEILQICRYNNLVPNFTTSGYGMTPEIAKLCKQYCGAVAVSWYRSEYTLRAIKMLLKAGVKTNIHYVLGKNSIDEAIDRLKKDDLPTGINAIIFLLHKPAGQGTAENMLSVSDPRVEEFFSLIDERHPFKVGMDSCNVPGAIKFCKSILPESLDTYESGNMIEIRDIFYLSIGRTAYVIRIQGKTLLCELVRILWILLAIYPK